MHGTNAKKKKIILTNFTIKRPWKVAVFYYNYVVYTPKALAQAETHVWIEHRLAQRSLESTGNMSRIQRQVNRAPPDMRNAMKGLNKQRIGEHGFITVVMGNFKKSRHFWFWLKADQNGRNSTWTPMHGFQNNSLEHRQKLALFGERGGGKKPEKWHIFRPNAFLPDVLRFSTQTKWILGHTQPKVTLISTGVLISPQPTQEGNRLVTDDFDFHIYKVKVSHKRPRWPKGFRVGSGPRFSWRSALRGW
jgi:hypothetical protein